MEIITNIIHQPLNDMDLARMLGPLKSKVKIMRYEELANKTLQSLFHGYMAIIVFLDIHNEHGVTPIGHWITLIDQDDHYEHFDSYGIGVDEEVAITHEKKDLISNLFKQSNKPLVESQRKLQSNKNDTNTCGRWCIARIRLGNYALPKFYHFIDTIHHIPDVAVVALTMFSG